MAAPPSYRVGQRVTLCRLPAGIDTMPVETRLAFELALGGCYRIAGFGRYGHLELVLTPAIDARVGGYLNTLWVEPELVEPAPPDLPKGGAVQAD